MINRQSCLTTIVKIDVINGTTSADVDSLAKILLDNENEKFTEEISHTKYEDCICPPNNIVNDIIDEMISDFKEATGEDIVCVEYWGHIHDKNMSTNQHNHNTYFASAVCYLSVPDGSGSLVFVPKVNPYNESTFKCEFAPKKGRYYMFPSYLDHFVTRNNSEEKRISISFNFERA